MHCNIVCRLWLVDGFSILVFQPEIVDQLSITVCYQSYLVSGASWAEKSATVSAMMSSFIDCEPDKWGCQSHRD